jgi:hypothetical protein
MRARDGSTISTPALLLVVPPVLLLILGDLLFWWFGWHGQSVVPQLSDMAQGREDATGRLYILTSFIVLCGVAFFALLLFCTDLIAEFDRAMRWRLLAIMAIGLTVGATWLLLSQWRVAEIDYVGGDFLQKVATQYARLGECQPGKGGRYICTGNAASTVLPQLEALLKAAKALATAGAAVVIMGAVSCGIRPAPGADAPTQRAFLRRQRARLRRYVNAAAAVMVAAVLFSFAWMAWPLPLLSGGMRTAYLEQIHALALFSGVTDTVVIAAFALPVAASLRNWSERLPPSGDGEDDPILAGGLLDSAGKILVVLAPALAGILPGLIDLARPLAG